MNIHSINVVLLALDMLITLKCAVMLALLIAAFLAFWFKIRFTIDLSERDEFGAYVDAGWCIDLPAWPLPIVVLTLVVFLWR